MKTGRPLVIAGIGRVDYALSAAVVVRHFGVGNADIFCTSTARLPSHLAEYADATQPPSEVVIVGIGLHAAPDQLLDAVRRLRKTGASVTWISRIPLPSVMPPETGDMVEVVCEEGAPLYEIAARKYGGDVAAFAKIDKAVQGGKRQDPYAEFILACYYYYRNFQVREHCYRVIRHLAIGDPPTAWGDEDRRIITTFQRNGRRELGGTSKLINELRDRIKKVARRDVARVLVVGESGTGKETVALLLHGESPRGKEAMISFNCASVTPNLLETRFLGSKKGAYTGAVDEDGLFKKAEGSTLFLDEIGELPLEAQGVLLRVLEEGKFYPLGGTEELKVDVHIIAATNRNLAQMVAEGKFREDLYYRLNIVQLKVPALRERIEDLKDIANHRWHELSGHWLTPAEEAELKAYDYPGNVRELFAILERAAIFGDSFTKVIAEERATQASVRKAATREPPDDLETVIRDHVRHVYDKYNGNVALAAKALGKAQNTVRKYLRD